MRYVKYIGPSHKRMILASDWRSVGINGETVEWSAFNGFAIPADHFTEDQLRKAIDPDPFLVITDDEDFTPTPQTRDMTPSQVEAPRVDVLDTVNGSNGSGDVAEPSGAPNELGPPDDKPAKRR